MSPYIAASAALVGKAFDYLLRFKLQRKFPDCAHTRRWVAESALRYFDEKDRSVWVRGKKLLEMEDAELLEFARQQQTRNDTLNVLQRYGQLNVVDYLVFELTTFPTNQQQQYNFDFFSCHLQ